MKILVGTNNPGKAAEVGKWLRDAGHEPVMPADLELLDMEETGNTFEENALLKARFYADRSGLACIADDSGLEVDFLGGAPGVKSKRWIGPDATWEDLAEAIVRKMEGHPDSERIARLRTVMAIAFPESAATHTAETTIEGKIAERLDLSLVSAGYPYRALLVVDQFGKLYAELTEDEHEQINQRRRAFKQLLPLLLQE